MHNTTNFHTLHQMKGLKLVHINIRSLFPKIDQLRIILENSPIDIITLSETWLNTSVDSKMVDIKGFKLFRLDRKNPDNRKRRGGGLLVYINIKLAQGAKSLENHNTLNGDIEAQWIEIEREHARNVVLCNLYRPPAGNVESAFNSLNKTLASLMSRKKDLFLLGDLNINYKNKLSVAYKKLSFFEKVHNLNQLITTDTRITKNTSTLIDLVLTNAQYIQHAGTLDTFISDHQPIFVVKKKQRSYKERANFEGRNYTKYDPDKFRNNHLDANWEKFYQGDEVDIKWGQMYGEIVRELNKQCPIEKFKQKLTKPPFLTADLLQQIKDRDYFYRKAKRTLNQDDWNIAKHLRNQTNRNIRNAKAQYTITQLNACGKNTSKFWRLIKEIVPNKKQHLKDQIRLKNGNNPIDADATADYINEFFINVGNTAKPSTAPTLTGIDQQRPPPSPSFQTISIAPLNKKIKQMSIG